MSDYLNEYKRLAVPFLDQIEEQGFDGMSYMGGQADLTPLKNRAREAVEALNDCQKAADSGRAEDAVEALRRARAAIDAALGGQLGQHGGMVPGPAPGNPMGPGRY